MQTKEINKISSQKPNFFVVSNPTRPDYTFSKSSKPGRHLVAGFADLRLPGIGSSADDTYGARLRSDCYWRVKDNATGVTVLPSTFVSVAFGDQFSLKKLRCNPKHEKTYVFPFEHSSDFSLKSTHFSTRRLSPESEAFCFEVAGGERPNSCDYLCRIPC